MSTPVLNKVDKYEELVRDKFTEGRIEVIRKAFKKFMLKQKKPKEGEERLPDRMLTMDIGPLMRILRYNPLESEIDDMEQEMDPNEEGTITFHQFLFLLWRKSLAGDDDDVIPAFKAFDFDETGFLSLQDLKKILTKTGERLNEEEFEAFVVHADIHEDGQIDYVDFVNRMNEEIEPAGKSKKSKGTKKSKK